MRKDLRVGLGIGGVVLAILVVVMVFRSNKPSTDVARNDTPATEPDAVNPNDPPPITDSTPTPPTVALEQPVLPIKAPDVFDPSAAAPKPPAVTAGVSRDPWGEIALSGRMDASPPSLTSTESGASPAHGKRATAVAIDSAPPAENRGADWLLANPGGPTVAGPGRSSAISDPGGATVKSSSKTTARADSHTHVVQQGETFSTIARAQYGNSKYYIQIEKANPNLDPTRLKTGVTISLPEIATASRTASTVRSGTSGGTASSASAIDRSKEYVVQSGDSLYRICAKLYGDGNKIDALYDANRNTIGPDRERLKIGMHLKLPGAPTSTATSMR